MADANNLMDVRVITPDKTFYVGKATMVEFNTTEGQIGVYKNHIPLTVIIKPGVLVITGEEVKKAALHSGFAEILNDSVTILAEVIEWGHEVDVNRAEEARERAKTRLQNNDGATDVARAETALLRAVARINATKI